MVNELLFLGGVYVRGGRLTSHNGIGGLGLLGGWAPSACE